MSPRDVNIVVLSGLLREQLTMSGRTSSPLIGELVELEETLDPEGKLS